MFVLIEFLKTNILITFLLLSCFFSFKKVIFGPIKNVCTFLVLCGAFWHFWVLFLLIYGIYVTVKVMSILDMFQHLNLFNNWIVLTIGFVWLVYFSLSRLKFEAQMALKEPKWLQEGSQEMQAFAGFFWHLAFEAQSKSKKMDPYKLIELLSESIFF